MPSENNNFTTDPTGALRAAIALGSNLGDRKKHLHGALDRLEHHPGINLLTVSPWFETAPVGGPPGQGLFLNAAAVIETTLLPRQVLDQLLAIEAAALRERRVPNAPRTLDLDLLFYCNRIIDEPGLSVPHPRLHERRFVLDPLVTIAPGWVHPILGQTVHELWLKLPPADEISLPARLGPPEHETHP